MQKTCKAVLTLALTLCAGLLSLSSNAQGRVFAWGQNFNGQLGNGTNANSDTPVQVAGLSSIFAAAGGGAHSLAVRTDGTVWAWGLNGNGQLGNGTNIDSYTPVQVPGLSKVVAVAAGSYNSVAIKSDGTVWTWGLNNYGQLGNGTNTDSNVPVQVVGLSKVVAAAVGHTHILALKSDGTVWAWGQNNAGELGNGTNTDSNVPVQVVGLSGISRVAAGGYHSLAASSSGLLMAWGFNGDGELGDGTTNSSNIPVLSNINSVYQIAAGFQHSCAVRFDGSVWVWGSNYESQLGIAGSLKGISTTPVQTPGLSAIYKISAGYDDSLTLTQGGAVLDWGQISYYLPTAFTPTLVTGLPGIVTVAAGGAHNLAVEGTGVTPTKLAVSSMTVQKGKLIVLSATVKSGGAPVPGLSIQLAVDGAPLGTFLTDANGQAKALYFVGETLALGAHKLTAFFAGDYTYAAASASSTLTVVKGAVKVLVANVSGHPGETVGLSATLTDAVGFALPGQVVSFSVGGHFFGNGITDGNGNVSVAYPIPVGMVKGTYALSVSFAGNSDHLTGVGSGKLTVR